MIGVFRHLGLGTSLATTVVRQDVEAGALITIERDSKLSGCPDEHARRNCGVASEDNAEQPNFQQTCCGGVTARARAFAALHSASLGWSV
jgi:hypothetical protein